MTLTLLMLRYMLYKSFIVYFSLYSIIHHLHVLHFALYLLSFLEELIIDGKMQELKKKSGKKQELKEENNKTGPTIAKREREKRIGLMIPLESISCIRHTHRD